MHDSIKKLSNQVDAGFSRVRKDLGDIELDNLLSSLQAMQFTYEGMHAAVTDTDLPVQIKKTYIEKYRAACNVPQHTPEDLFRQFYGFACGDNAADRECDAGQGEDTGTCKFGVQRRQYLLDIYHDEEGKDIVTNVQGFGRWILNAMLLAQFHYNSCLPADAASCNDPFTDPIRKKTSHNLQLAFEETADNVQNRLDCILKERFYEFLGKDDGDFFRNYVENEECFDEVEVEWNDPNYHTNVNACMADKTRVALETYFYDKYWTVVVYSCGAFGCDVFPEDDTVKRCASYEVGNNFGCISVDKVDFPSKGTDRYFHLMFRNNLILPKDRDWMQNVPVDENDNPVFVGKYELRDYDQEWVLDYWCFGHPLDPWATIESLASEQGYIAIKRRELDTWNPDSGWNRVNSAVSTSPKGGRNFTIAAFGSNAAVTRRTSDCSSALDGTVNATDIWEFDLVY